MSRSPVHRQRPSGSRWHCLSCPSVAQIGQGEAYEEILWFRRSAHPYAELKACGQWADDISFRGSSRFGFGGPSPIHSGQNTSPQPGQTRIPDVIEVSVSKIEAGIQHPAMFPVEMAEILVKTFCPPKGVSLTISVAGRQVPALTSSRHNNGRNGNTNSSGNGRHVPRRAK